MRGGRAKETGERRSADPSIRYKPFLNAVYSGAHRDLTLQNK